MGADGILSGPDIDLLDKVSQMTGVKFVYQLGRTYSSIMQQVLFQLHLKNSSLLPAQEITMA